MQNDDVLVRVEHVSKKFCRGLKKSLWYGVQDIAGELLCRNNTNSLLRSDEFWALQEISLELRRGECLGLIGRNGAGKTTLLRMLNGLIKPDQGYIKMRGRIGALIALGAGFNPILTGRENIYVNASVLGLSKREIDGKVDEIIDFAELEEFIDMPLQNYSSGMQVRLGFAVATALKPDVLLLDEILAVGDLNFRTKCFQRMGDILQHTALIFVSHNIPQIQRICDRVLYLKHGKLKFFGDVSTGVTNYLEENVRELDTLLLKGEGVESVSIDSVRPIITYGEEQKISVNVQCERPQQLDLCLISFSDQAGNLCAQGDFSEQLSSLPAGVSTFAIRIPELCLSGGKYYVNISIYSSNGKRTVLHLRNSAIFRMDSPVGYGVPYQVKPLIERRAI